MKKKIPRKHATLFWAEDLNGRVLIEKRPAKGLLGGLMGFPTSPWEEVSDDALKFAPIEGKWMPVDGTITHTFTHFHLTFSIVRTVVEHKTEGVWVKKEDLVHYAFPTLMQKVIQRMEEERRAAIGA